jgi:hypothetical protein
MSTEEGPSKRARTRGAEGGVNSHREAEGGVGSHRPGDSEGDCEGGGHKRSKKAAETVTVFDYYAEMQKTGSKLDAEQPPAQKGESLLARLGQLGCPSSAGHARQQSKPSCCLPDCLDQSKHERDPYITTPGPAGQPHVPKTCEAPGCEKILYRCEVQPWVWTLAKAGKRPKKLRCNKCRGGWGWCPRTGGLASITADIAECASGVRDLQNLFADEAMDAERFGKAEAQSVMDALMRAVDQCVADAPEGTMLLVAVQKASGDWLQEVYDLWDRDGIKALLQSIGATAPSHDGNDLLFTACGPLIKDDLANWIETQTQFTVLARVLHGEVQLFKKSWREKNVIPAFCRATAVDYQDGKGRQPGSAAMGQGGGRIKSFSGVSVWRVNPVPTLDLLPVVAETPRHQLPRVTGDRLSEGAYKRIMYGASENMLKTAREKSFRSAEPWSHVDRKALAEQCSATARDGCSNVRTFPFPFSKPSQAVRYTDSATISMALKALRDQWGEKKQAVMQVHNKLKRTVYDKWGQGKRSWVDIRARTGRTKRLLTLFNEFVSADGKWDDEFIATRVGALEAPAEEVQMDSEEDEEDEVLLHAPGEDLSGQDADIGVSDGV